jgi:photosystem II stability/assembly factor-like uncharacterized protein
MKKILAFLFVFSTFATPCAAQWKTAAYNDQILAFGVHDTNFFVSSNGGVNRYAPWQGAFQWVESDGGIDFTNENVTSFASLGTYFFAGCVEGGLYRSTNDGASWNQLQSDGPVYSNGTYLFGNSLSSAYRSRDNGSNWQTMNCPEASSYASIGSYIFAIANNGLMRSTDTGNTWTKISPPFIGTMTVMGSLLFMADTGSVSVSADSGTKWQALPVDTAGEYERVTVLVTDGKNLFAGTPNGVLVSTDSGHSWRNGGEDGLPSKGILTLGVFDTLLFCQVQGARGQLYTAVRPISQMVDTTPSAVQVIAPPSDTIAVYPNPATETVTILAGGTSIYGVSVMNVLGENVLDMPNLRESDITLDLSKIPSGTYFLQIETGNGSVLRKVVIQR